MKNKFLWILGFMITILMVVGFTVQVQAATFGDKKVVHYVWEIPENWVMVGTIAPFVDKSNPNYTGEYNYTIMYIGGANYGDIVDIVMSRSPKEQYNIPYGWEIIESSVTLVGNLCKIQYKPTHYPMKELSKVSSGANGVNGNNQIVGWAETSDWKKHAYIWENDKMTELLALGEFESEARGINEEGKIVGWFEISGGTRHAFIWENGKVTDLGTLGGNNSEAYGINNKGQVVGWSETANGKKHACLWEAGKISDLGTLGGNESEAHGINDKGQVVGWAYTSDDKEHAFKWENGKMTDLGTSDTWSEANGINNNGQIVGTGGSFGATCAILWENGEMKYLGYLVSGCGTQSYAFAINDKGQIVGKSTVRVPDSLSDTLHAFIWQDWKMTDLGSYGTAYGINNMGLIAGTNGNACIWDNNADSTLPSINGINPSDNSILDAEAKITVKASDNNGVKYIMLQYSLDGNSWKDIGCQLDRNNAEFTWVTTELTGSVKVKATAIDIWGNESTDSPVYTYKISTVPARSLGTLGGNESDANGINDEGQVVGRAYTYENNVHAFLWETGKINDLGTLGGNSSEAYGVNNKGQVVGEAKTKYGESHAFIWEKGKMTDLGAFGGTRSIAKGINSKSQVVGEYVTPNGYDHAFIWENGKATDLGTLGGIRSRANEVNDNAQVVGYALNSDGKGHAFIYENGKMTDLGTLGGYESEAHGINNNGQVVGWSITSDNKRHAFIWENGKMTDLSTPAESWSEAYGINDKSQVVGCFKSLNGGVHACIWEEGKMTDLGTFNRESSYAKKIANKGQIIGGLGYGANDKEKYACIWRGETEQIPPSIASIEPSDNSILNGEAKIKVNANDNIEVRSIKLQYSQDGIKWNDAGYQNTKGTAEFILDTTEFKDSIKVRAVAVDIWGNESSDSPVYKYKISASIPAKDLGTLGGNKSEANGINDDGQVVGWSEIADGNTHAFIWENGKMTDLGTLGGSWSKAYGLNNKKQVVGTSETADRNAHAFIWENGKMTDLGTLGGNRSDAYGINDKGQIIGTAYSYDSKTHIFVWDNGRMNDFGDYYSSNPQAYGINDNEQFISYYSSSSYINNFKISGLGWTGNGKGLSSLGRHFSFPYGLNDKGQVVGYSETSYALNHAFIWEDGKMTDLGTLGGDSSKALGLNDNGQVVGVAQKVNGMNHAFIWENAKMSDLGTLGKRNSYAKGINNKGQIIGCYYTTDDLRACIWDSSTEPATEKIIYGDSSGDGVVDSADFTLFRKYLLGIIHVLPNLNFEKAMDLNKDDYIDSADYTILGRYLLGRVKSLPCE